MIFTMQWRQYKRLRAVLIFCRVLLGVMWLISAFFKFADLDWFTKAVRNYQLPPFDLPPYDVFIAYGVPTFELIAGSCLVLSLCIRAALLLSGSLFCVFLIPIVHAWRLGYAISCGCIGGYSGEIHYPIHVGGLVLGVVFVCVLFLNEKPCSIKATCGEVKEVGE